MIADPIDGFTEVNYAGILIKTVYDVEKLCSKNAPVIKEYVAFSSVLHCVSLEP